MVAAEASRALISVGIRGRLAPRLEIGEQGQDVGRVLHRVVRAEEQLGGGAQVEVPAQPAPHEAPRALERLERGGPLRFRAQHRDVDLGVLEVRARVDLGDGDEAEARILELSLDEHRDLFLDQLVDPLESLGLHWLCVPSPRVCILPEGCPPRPGRPRWAAADASLLIRSARLRLRLAKPLPAPVGPPPVSCRRRFFTYPLGSPAAAPRQATPRPGRAAPGGLPPTLLYLSARLACGCASPSHYHPAPGDSRVGPCFTGPPRGCR